MKNDFKMITKKLQDSVEKGHVFFHIPNLKYLIAGGRIGRVTGAVGTLLNIQPIITCDEEGIYTTIAKIRASKTNNRSEERRVGKKYRSQRARYDHRKN